MYVVASSPGSPIRLFGEPGDEAMHVVLLQYIVDLEAYKYISALFKCDPA